MNVSSKTRPDAQPLPGLSPAEQGPAEPGLAELDQPRFMDWASDTWGIRFVPGQDRCLIHGSPERAMSRGVASDSGGRRFLVEKFSREAFGLKEEIALTLTGLKGEGLKGILVPEVTPSGEYLQAYQGDFFQVTRFVEGTDLPRPGWLASRERGRAMASFLIHMRQCAGRLTRRSPFSIKRYIYRLFEDMARHHPDRHRQYLPILRFLEKEFMAAHDSLAGAFCHGDFHPINVIWNGEGISAVIDWEFTGFKPELYDAANLVGCAGIEHPEGLAMPMVTTFLSLLRREGVISPEGWPWLPDYVIALRFAWLSEWLRKNDLEMLDTEFRFMEVLMAHRSDLVEIWTDACERS